MDTNPRWYETAPGKPRRNRRLSTERAEQITSTFGPLLKQLREKQHVSQSRLSVRIGCDHSFVSRLESGARTASPEMVAMIADSLGFDEESSAYRDLMTAAGYTLTTTPLHPTIERLNAGLASVDPVTQARVLASISILVDYVESVK